MTRIAATPVRASIATGVLGLTLALMGCWGPVHGTHAMVEESDRVLAIAEETIPAIAQTLALTITEAESVPDTSPGSEGSPWRFRFAVEGAFSGELPKQQALENAIVTAGFADVITENTAGHAYPGTDSAPRVVAINRDESVQISIQLVTGTYRDGLRFFVASHEDFNVSDDANREYFPDLIPTFDQSLVSP